MRLAINKKVCKVRNTVFIDELKFPTPEGDDFIKLKRQIERRCLI